MSRPIKFRAWYIGQRRMLNDVCVMFCPGELREWRIFTSSDGEFLGNDKHFEVMQFTGLLDKAGKEIYEGDVYRFYSPAFKTTLTRVIEWPFDPTMLDCEGEVIGNIYEHPDLLK